MAAAGHRAGSQPAESAVLDRGAADVTVQPRPSITAARALLVIALAFFLVGFLLREDYGSTWDEAESYEAGRRNLEIVAGVVSGERGEIEWPWHELPSHQLVLDTLRAATARAIERLLPASPAPIGERLFNLALTSSSLVLAGLLVFEITASASLATFAATTLALQPKLIAHAQNNPKDLPGLVVFTLGVLMVVRLEARPSGLRAIAAAAAIGLAISTWLPAIALVPVAAFVLLAPWRRAASSRAPDRPPERWPARAGRLAVVIVGALATAFALWPWLWPGPIARLGKIAERLAEFASGFDVLYFGRLYPSNALPWHYTLGSILVSTPLVVTLLAILGAASAARAQDRRRSSLAALALVWIASLLLLDAVAAFHYDGMRHWLAVLPAVAMLAALGVDRARLAIDRVLRRSVSPRAATAGAAFVLALPALAIVIDVARLHPYQDAYLAWPARRLRSGASERMFEIEYWGASYRAVAQWLNQHAEPNAVVVAPIAPHCLEPYLRSDLTAHERLRPRVAASNRPYVVFMTREAWYRPLGLDRVIAGGPALHSVRTPLGTLAVVYRPDHIPDPLTRPGGPRSWRPPPRRPRRR